MQEDFLHYVWKYKKFDFSAAQTSVGEKITLLHTGQHNQEESGPDFFNAQLKISRQHWAGNVEIHLKSSDWYAHKHETDSAYDNVILHVVWQNDMPVFRKDNTPIPTLELHALIHANALKNYAQLLRNPNKKWINCENDFTLFSEFSLENWLERLYFERLEDKTQPIFQLLEQSQNNWEAVLFRLLFKNFGLNVNGDAFFEVARSIPFSVVQKTRHSTLQLEALFFGQAGMLQQDCEETYFLQLKKEYAFLQKKFNLPPPSNNTVKFFRLRPDNFPTIRLAQLAQLYSHKTHLFSTLIEEKNTASLHQNLYTEVSPFWETHYTFPKTSKKKKKALSQKFINLLLINTVIPLQFCYAKHKGLSIEDHILSLITSIPAETNTVIEKFDSLRHKKAKHALHSQAYLQLKKNYCDQNRCLQCPLGTQLLNRNKT